MQYIFHFARADLESENWVCPSTTSGNIARKESKEGYGRAILTSSKKWLTRRYINSVSIHVCRNMELTCSK